MGVIRGIEEQQDTASLPLFTVTQAGFPAWISEQPEAVRSFLTAAGFHAAAGDLRLLPSAEGLAGAVLGLGAEAGDRITPWTFGKLPDSLPSGSIWHLAEADLEDLAVLGWALGAYRYERYRPVKRPVARLKPRAAQGEAQGETIALARAIYGARDLINTPASDLGPRELAQAVADLAHRFGARADVIEGEELQQGFPAIAAVGRGSDRPPCVALLEWGRAEDPLLALCGKGVVFDTGGLDLKAPEGMRRMKKDMGGAAVMLGLAEAIMETGLPVRLLLAIGCVENAVSGRAMRPSDVIRTRGGLTVEIGNTDAEGRLVLADLLSLACERNPDLLIDAATLTGAARVALGPDLPALFTDDDQVASCLMEAGRRVHDPVWRMPIHNGYASWLDSSVADINNIGQRPMAGAIIAALFLRKFVPETVRWAHLDLYGWNDNARPGRPEGGEAQALRALFAGLTKCFGAGEKIMFSP